MYFCFALNQLSYKTWLCFNTAVSFNTGFPVCMFFFFFFFFFFSFGSGSRRHFLPGSHGIHVLARVRVGIQDYQCLFDSQLVCHVH